MAAPVYQSSTSNSASGGNVVFASPNVTGTDTLLIVSAGGGANALGDRSPTNVTRPSSTFGKLGEGDDGAWVNCEVWGAIGPAAGTGNITVAFSGGAGQSAAGASLLTGVNQTGGASTYNTVATGGNSGNTSNTLTVTSAADELVISGTSTDDESGITVSGGGTQNWAVTGVGEDTTYAMQRKAGSAPNVTMSWTQDINGWASVGVSIKGSGGAPAAATYPGADGCGVF